MIIQHKEKILEALDKAVGQDLIESISKVRTAFGLSNREFMYVYTEWFNGKVHEETMGKVKEELYNKFGVNDK